MEPFGFSKMYSTFNRCLLCTYYVAGRVLDAGGRAVTLPLPVEHFDGVGRQQEIKDHRW